MVREWMLLCSDKDLFQKPMWRKICLSLRLLCSRSYAHLNSTLVLKFCCGQSTKQDVSRRIPFLVLVRVPATMRGWPQGRPGFWEFGLRRGRMLLALCPDPPQPCPPLLFLLMGWAWGGRGMLRLEAGSQFLEEGLNLEWQWCKGHIITTRPLGAGG